VSNTPEQGQNNRAENSQQPTRLRERVMIPFKSAGHAQHFPLPSESFPHTLEWGDIRTEPAFTAL
jgi:hypothetical protein